MSGRQETMRLYRDFLRLRHQFPNKQGRSLLRRWTTVLFTARQGQYEELQRSHGVQAADKKAAEWRVEAKEDYEVWKRLSERDEHGRRKVINDILKAEGK